MCFHKFQRPTDDSSVSENEAFLELESDEDNQSESDTDSSSSMSSSSSSSSSSASAASSSSSSSNSEEETELEDSSDNSSISDNEIAPEPEVQSDKDNNLLVSDTDSSSSDSDDDESMLEDNIDRIMTDLVDELSDSYNSGAVSQDGDDVNDSEEYEEINEVVSSNSERHRNQPPNLSVGNVLIGGFSFHPSTNVIALGLSNGDISMYKYSNEKNEHLRTNNYVHLKKVLVLEYNKTGDFIYSACKDNNVSVLDTETGKLKVYFEKAHQTGSFVTALSIIDENSFATGGKDGVVNVWDVRANGCRFSLKKTEGSINSMLAIDNSSNQPTLACASGDGTLTIIDLSAKKMVIQSEPYKSMLTSCVTMKRKTKLVCGTSEGSLIIFNTGDYSVFNDEFPCADKNAAVNKLVPVTQNMVLSALDNGKIRAINLFPNCNLGIVHHQEMSVDLLDISDTDHLIASASYYSNIVKFCNIKEISRTWL